MLPEFDKWPIILQVFAYIGAAAAGAFVLLRGAKSKPDASGSPLEIELKAIRADFAMAIEALKVSVHDEFGRLRAAVDGVHELLEAYEKRLRDAERTIAILEDRDDRRRR